MSGGTGPSRRQVLRGGAALGGFALAGCAVLSDEKPENQGRYFRLGVASGEPMHDSVVIWTRLASDPLNGGGMPELPVEVRWEVAVDDKFRRLVRHGTVVALPENAHSVHVDVQPLEANRWYWYRFHVGEETSATGRTRTAPEPAVDIRQIRFAFASCQNYEQGYYTAYRHMAAEDLDLVVHLGDYIYENGIRPGLPRVHDGPVTVTLEDYRNRYALYRLDPDLQAAHAAFPWAVVWDDHEVANDYAGDIDESEPDGVEKFLKRRAAAYQAYYEHMPLRAAARPSGPKMQLYRRLPFGNLATFYLLDTRQYRSDQPCGNGWKPPCEGSSNESATMLGPNQEQWLENGLSASRTKWNVLAQQVPMMQRRRYNDGRLQFNMDKWDGYRAARQRLFDAIQRHRPSGLNVITGDVHAAWVGDLKQDFDDPTSPTIGTEFVGTSISSRGDGWDIQPRFARMLDANPHIRYYNGRRGYFRCSVTDYEWRADFRAVPYVSNPGAPISTLRSFAVDRRNPGVVVA